MKNKLFQQINRPKIQRATFDMSHERKLSAAFGNLYPVFVKDVVPGDRWSVISQMMIRMAPLVSPVYHRMNAYIHWFYVPDRITAFRDVNGVNETQWNAWITNQDISSLPWRDFPQQVQVGSLADHLGFPTGDFPSIELDVNEMAFRAYYQIYNDHYMDSNLSQQVQYWDPNFDLFNGPIMKRKWAKDYFTSALPTPQKGAAAGVDVGVVYKDTLLDDTQSGTAPSGTLQTGDAAGSGKTYLRTSNSNNRVVVENISAITLYLEKIREAASLQRFAERLMKAGNRYVEYLNAVWGVKSSDQRLDRCEYLGGGAMPLVISEVLQTSESNNSPQGTLAGHGLGLGTAAFQNKFFEEHGIIMGILSILPEANYYQGLDKMHTRLSNIERYSPDFANLGEEEVKLRELYLMPGKEQTTFGYQARWNDMRHIPSTIHGAFRDSLLHWTMARKFNTEPALNETFIQCAPDDRIFAVEGQEQMYVQIYHNVTANRPMPYIVDPSIV